MEIKYSSENRKWRSGTKFTCIFRDVTFYEDNRRVDFDPRSLAGRGIAEVQGIVCFNSTLSSFPFNFTETFPNLTALSFQGCGLPELTRSDLVGLESLVELDLRKNEMTSLQIDVLSHMKHLKWVDFSENRIKYLDSRMFDGIKNQIEVLDLSYNIRINDCFNRADGKSIEDFIRIIDTKCQKPANAPSAITAPSSSVYEAKNYSEGFLKGFEALWLTHRFADLTIVVEKAEFKVHKAVLATQSKVFASMFENDKEERKTNRLSILNFSASAFEDFLSFIYTGKVKKGMNAVELFSIASMYNVLQLKDIAEKAMLNNVDVSNAMAILVLANVNESDILMRRSFDLIRRAYPGIVFQDSLMKKPEVVKKLIDAKEEYDRALEEARRNLENVVMNAT